MKKFADEFKKFAVRGNVVDLAVGVIIGAAFGKITTSLVEDIMLPPLGLLLGKVDFANLFFTISGGKFDTLAAAEAAGAVTINYGMFLNNVINFILTAFAIFIVIRQMNRFHKKEEAKAATPTTKKCPECRSDIPLDATRCAHCTIDLSKTPN